MFNFKLNLFVREDPFVQEQPEDAFYHPTTPKYVDFDERMTCFSGSNAMQKDIVKEKNVLEAGNFQLNPNTLLPDDLPTRDVTTSECNDNSGSSKFNETWPSTTEQLSSASPNTESSLNSARNTIFNAIKEDTSARSQRMSNSGNYQKGTIAEYISRFRNQPPKSREERQRNISSVGDFWWLNLPDNASTPKDFNSSSSSPPERLRKTNTPKRPPKSPDQRRRDRSQREMRSFKHEGKEQSSSTRSVEESDSETAIVQKRAERLLELSEGTLSSFSSDQRIGLSMPPKHKSSSSLSSLPFSSSTKEQGVLYSSHIPAPLTGDPAPSRQSKIAPENDILYQWRLARKMEQAKQVEKAFEKIPHLKMQTLSNSNDTRHAMNQADKTKEIEATVSTVLKKNTPKTDVSSKQDETNGANTDVKRNVKNTCSQTITQYKHSTDGSRFDVEYVDLPAHMHTVCDILPCPHEVNKQCTKEQVRENDEALRQCCQQKELLKSTNKPLKLNPPILNCEQEMSLDSLSKQSENSSLDIQGKKSITVGAKAGITTANEDQLMKNGNKDDDKDAEYDHNRQGQTKKRNDRSIEEGREKTEGEKKKDEDVRDVINKVVSDHLFSTYLENGDSSQCKADRIVETGSEKEVELFSNSQEEDSDCEFADDEILKILRKRRKEYLQNLRKIEEILAESPTRY
eukprot:gene11347-12530_t